MPSQFPRVQSDVFKVLLLSNELSKTQRLFIDCHKWQRQAARLMNWNVDCEPDLINQHQCWTSLMLWCQVQHLVESLNPAEPRLLQRQINDQDLRMRCSTITYSWNVQVCIHFLPFCGSSRHTVHSSYSTVWGKTRVQSEINSQAFHWELWIELYCTIGGTTCCLSFLKSQSRFTPASLLNRAKLKFMLL